MTGKYFIEQLSLCPDKPMKGWVSLPFEHSDKWAVFTKKALVFVKRLKKITKARQITNATKTGV